jgi:plastocyanin
MRKTILRLAALSLVALVLFTPTAGAQGETATVSIKDFAFGPPNATIAPGTTVTWVNNDQVPHTATANDGAFDSGTLQPGQSYSFKFDRPGTYAYHCNIHPDMTATIIVSGASASPSASTSSSASSSASPSTSPSASSSASGSASGSPSGSPSPTAGVSSSPTAGATTSHGTRLPTSGGTLVLVAGLALVALAIALVLVVVRRGAAS